MSTRPTTQPMTQLQEEHSPKPQYKQRAVVGQYASQAAGNSTGGCHLRYTFGSGLLSPQTGQEGGSESPDSPTQMHIYWSCIKDELMSIFVRTP